MKIILAWFYYPFFSIIIYASWFFLFMKTTLRFPESSWPFLCQRYFIFIRYARSKNPILLFLKLISQPVLISHLSIIALRCLNLVAPHLKVINLTVSLLCIYTFQIRLINWISVEFTRERRLSHFTLQKRNRVIPPIFHKNVDFLEKSQRRVSKKC